MSAETPSGLLEVHNQETLPPQEIIDLFKVAFGNELYGTDALDELQSQIQKVKTDLYNRDYISAFNSEEKRVSYCCRWSPSRATAYASLFAHFKEIVQVVQCHECDQKILCVGGGAGGELVALASLFTPSREFSNKYSTSRPSSSPKKSLNIHVVDISDWSVVVDKLQRTIQERWLYAGEAQHFRVQFSHNDILQMSEDRLALSELNLITLLFTTNELFAENKQQSIRLLQKFNQFCSPGCYLLITESAGSYSHITVGTKKFPIQFLIDTILLGKKGQDSAGPWQLVHQNDSIWYRCDPKIDYPMKLENSRIFYRLYKKI
ncbi:hypothetical protein HG536_0B06720 [Torulaspora globosa]|uniref:25S rRNA (Uridine(2843)-N(3))-methyltransferase n=1 Tax=Torulaspora globosa TaxID=48254 RepID=A0A7G3ZE68_9SACH|nr:uncharacterized protein HG536_0B06720 [Torulaspora globosa]QLL31804.1 hypothetical protein HG536_0B06720 [Torulaspora globosa]